MLLRHPRVNVNAADKDGESPLFVACVNDDRELVGTLLHHPKTSVSMAEKRRCCAVCRHGGRGNSWSAGV
eukprot:1195462-Prorocentrum_minimum.AAC.3